MSVRAYRINNIDHERGESFNLWHSDEITDWLNDHTDFYSNFSEGSGIGEVSVEDLEKMLSELKSMDEEDRKAIQKDIDWAKKNGESYVQYYCY